MIPVSRIALAALALLAASEAAADDDSLATVARGFYDAYATIRPSDGIPDAAARGKYEPFVTPALDRLLKEARQAEETFAKSHKNSPPLLEGDLMTSNFEGATSYKVALCRSSGPAGSCTVDFVYAAGGDKPVTWTDTLILARTGQGWRVDDIGYGANWAFANKGRLTATLHEAVANATE
jgi:hypothetical protein